MSAHMDEALAKKAADEAETTPEPVSYAEAYEGFRLVTDRLNKELAAVKASAQRDVRELILERNDALAAKYRAQETAEALRRAEAHWRERAVRRPGRTEWAYDQGELTVPYLVGSRDAAKAAADRVGGRALYREVTPWASIEADR